MQRDSSNRSCFRIDAGEAAFPMHISKYLRSVTSRSDSYCGEMRDVISAVITHELI